MVSKKRDFDGSRDLISDLPDPLIGHILSFLPTKQAASTSDLSSKWRYLFAFVSNLDFDDSDYLDPRKEKSNNVSASFMDFVGRVLAVQGNSPLHTFSLKINDYDDPDDPVDPIRVFTWILNVLQRGVSVLDLHMDLVSESLLPSKIFLSETLVTLKLNCGDPPSIDVGDVYLPKLKTLYLSVGFENNGIELAQLLSGCPMLEDLVLDYISWHLWDFASVSVTSLKRLTFRWGERDDNPKSVSFDTPNLVYLEFADTIADKYPKVNFDSLVEAQIDLRMSYGQLWEARFKEEASSADLQNYYAEGNEETNMVGNATDFITGLCNVKILYLSAHTLQVLNYCCEELPLFNNLTHLTIESKPTVGWESLPGLLEISPNLETLVFQGLVHKATDGCGDVCLCRPYEKEDILSCLSSSPVKVLKVLKFGEIVDDDIDKLVEQVQMQIEQVKHFLETMPNLEQLILYYDTSCEEDVILVSSQIHGLPKVASSKCNLQLISDHLSLSSTLPASVSMKWASFP